MNHSMMISTAALCVAGCVTINLPPPPGPLQEKVVAGAGAAKIALIDVSGVITDEDEQGVLREQPSLVESFREALDRARSDDAVRAVVLRINSPGGTVTASDIMHHDLQRFKNRSKKKVVAAIMDVGASGGYYIAAAADRIVAHPTAITGSIGVIMLTVNVQGLLEKIGVQGEAIKSGRHKDIGSPLRPLEPEERAIFQGVIDQLYGRFVAVVADGRSNLPVERVRALADGRIYTGVQAQELGLVDQVGYLEDAIKEAMKLAELTEAKVVTYHRPGSYRANIYSSNGAPDGVNINLVQFDLRALVHPDSPRFMYLWAP
jgi:protease-4